MDPICLLLDKGRYTVLLFLKAKKIRLLLKNIQA